MADAKTTRPKGCRYHLTDPAILKFMQWPIETRLEWLEEANRFLFEALSPDAKAIREAFRKAEL